MIHDVKKIKTKGGILQNGCFIGENSVIGTGSVISTSVPENEIWGGNPAKFIRKVNESIN